MQRIFKIAICQTKVTENKVRNILEAYKHAKIAKQMGTDVIVFGEYFTNVNASQLFKSYSENIGKHSNDVLVNDIQEMITGKNSIEMEVVLPRIMESEISGFLFLKVLSYELDLLIVGGSLVEAENDKLYNTCFVFDKGELIAKHRKIHLFDIDIPGKMTFKESETISTGNQATVFQTRFGKFGIGICYDIRFASYAMLLRQMGAEVLIYPSVFNQETGPRHFLLSGQARALDTQCYVILASCAQYKDKPEYYQSFGHSAIIDCDGRVREHLSREEGILLGEVDLKMVEEIRSTIPYTSEKQTRSDIYGFEIFKKKE